MHLNQGTGGGRRVKWVHRVNHRPGLFKIVHAGQELWLIQPKLNLKSLTNITNFISSHLLKALVIPGVKKSARNPNPQVVITHASRECSQHSFELHWECMESIKCTLIMHALTICHLSLQSTALEQKRFDLESLLPVLPNLWLLLVLTLIKVMAAVEI